MVRAALLLVGALGVSATLAADLPERIERGRYLTILGGRPSVERHGLDGASKRVDQPMQRA